MNLGMINSKVLSRAGLAPLSTVRSKEHARVQAEESLQHAQLQREKLMNLIQSNHNTVKHNILDFGGPYGFAEEDWNRINQNYLCEYVLVSLVNGSFKRSTNAFSPLSNDIAIGFPVISNNQKSLHAFFSMVGDGQSHAFLTLIGHAVDQVDTSKHMCTPIHNLLNFADEVIVPITSSVVLNEEDMDSEDFMFTTRGGAGIGIRPRESSSTNCSIGPVLPSDKYGDVAHVSEPTVFKSFICSDPWTPIFSTKTASEGMVDMVRTFFSNDSVDMGKTTHLTHGICITGKEMGTKSIIHNKKMVSIHHTMAPLNPNHCLATMVLHDKSTGESYTHVAILDMGRGRKSHANLVASFYHLGKYALCAGGPGVNPFYVSESRINSVKMTQGYEFAQVSNPLSFFYAPTMQVSLHSCTREYEVGMSVHSLRHLPDDREVVLGTPMVIDSGVNDWVGWKMEEHAKLGRFCGKRCDENP